MTTAVRPEPTFSGPEIGSCALAEPVVAGDLGAVLVEQLVTDALRAVDGQLLVSQGFCVDVLLDIYNAAEGPVVRSVIAERLDDIRRLNAVAADDFEADLWAVLAIVAAEAVLADA